MNWKRSLAGLLLVSGISAGCATASDPYYSATPPVVGHTARTDAPQIDNADAAGVASVPGTRTGVGTEILTPAPAASPVVIVPAPADSSVIVVPPAQPR